MAPCPRDHAVRVHSCKRKVMHSRNAPRALNNTWPDQHLCTEQRYSMFHKHVRNSCQTMILSNMAVTTIKGGWTLQVSLNLTDSVAQLPVNRHIHIQHIQCFSVTSWVTSLAWQLSKCRQCSIQLPKRFCLGLQRVFSKAEIFYEQPWQSNSLRSIHQKGQAVGSQQFHCHHLNLLQCSFKTRKIWQLLEHLQEAQLLQRDHAMLCVIKYFAN